MSLFIAAEDVERMARQVAEVRHTSVTDALRQLLLVEVGKLDRETAKAERIRKMDALTAELRARGPVEPWDDSEMYDENGLPK